MNQVYSLNSPTKANDLLFCFSLFRCQFRPSLPICASLVIALKMNYAKILPGLLYGGQEAFLFLQTAFKGS